MGNAYCKVCYGGAYKPEAIVSLSIPAVDVLDEQWTSKYTYVHSIINNFRKILWQIMEVFKILINYFNYVRTYYYLIYVMAR